jgi:hypothetical protein
MIFPLNTAVFFRRLNFAPFGCARNQVKTLMIARATNKADQTMKMTAKVKTNVATPQAQMGTGDGAMALGEALSP